MHQVVTDPAHRGLVQRDNVQIECSKQIENLLVQNEKLEKLRVDEAKHITKLRKEKSDLESALTERDNTIAKLKQEVRTLELKSGKPPSSSSSSSGGSGGKDWQAHSKEQSRKIVELKKQIKLLEEVNS